MGACREVSFGSDSDVVMRNSGRSVFIEQRKSRPPSYQFKDENGAGRAAQAEPWATYHMGCMDCSVAKVGCS
jgi:hypothetical protein